MARPWHLLCLADLRSRSTLRSNLRSVRRTNSSLRPPLPSWLARIWSSYPPLNILTDSKLYLYAGLAVCGSLMSISLPPVTSWDWYRYVLTAIAQGLLAAKAYQSQPENSAPNANSNQIQTPPASTLTLPSAPVVLHDRQG